MTRFLSLALAAAGAPALAQSPPPPAPPPVDCSTVVVTTAGASQLPALERDAKCFRSVEAGWDKVADHARERQAAARAAARYRELRAQLVRDGLAKPQPPAPPPEERPAPPAPVLQPDGTVQLPRVASNFDPALLLRQIPIADTGKPDVVGAFRFLCGPAGLAYADPIVHAGDLTGKSHLHQFFGNTLTDGASTYQTLRTTGDSTCLNKSNRSPYWVPAMLQDRPDGVTEVVEAHNLNVYYKRRPKDDPWYQANGVVPVDLPRGLRFVFGAPTSKPSFKCINPKTWADTPYRGDLPTALADCRVGDWLVATVASPQCWNGRELDSADHRSHMAYARGGAEHGWVTKCPASHRFEVPQFTAAVAWQILTTDTPSTWRFSSDGMFGPAARGTDFHADWWGAWDDTILATWQEWCIDKLLTCAAGNLGNGTMMVENQLTRESLGRNARLPLPARPAHQH